VQQGQQLLAQQLLAQQLLAQQLLAQLEPRPVQLVLQLVVRSERLGQQVLLNQNLQ
jgi:hypothetical protein